MTEPERRFFFYHWRSLCQNCLLSKHQKKQGFQDPHPQLSGKDIFTWNDVSLAFKEEIMREEQKESSPAPDVRIS